METLNNPTLQTILGAFLGALLGWIFSIISSNPQKEFRNLTIVETKIFIKNINIKSNSKDDSNDPTMILFSLLGVFIFATFSYIKYYIQVFEFLKLYEFFILFFILVVFIQTDWFKNNILN